MYLSDCTFSYIFQPNPSIRKLIFQIEDSMVGYIKPFQMHSLPEDAPFELPRISAKAENEHNSNLLISAQGAQVRSEFDEEHRESIVECIEYSRKKAHDLFKGMRTVEVDAIFAGLSACFLVPASECGGAPSGFINDSYLTFKSDLSLCDASAKVVYSIDENYFLNIEVSKCIPSQPLSIVVAPNRVDVDFGRNDGEEVLRIAIDFNNRLAFNAGQQAGCSEEVIDNLYSRVLTFFKTGISAFLKEGKVLF